jgi:hypothetical protein
MRPLGAKIITTVNFKLLSSHEQAKLNLYEKSKFKDLDLT